MSQQTERTGRKPKVRLQAIAGALQPVQRRRRAVGRQPHPRPGQHRHAALRRPAALGTRTDRHLRHQPAEPARGDPCAFDARSRRHPPRRRRLRHRPQGAHAACPARLLPRRCRNPTSPTSSRAAASSRSRSCGGPRSTRLPRTSRRSTGCWSPMRRCWPILSASASSMPLPRAVCRRSPATVVLERIAYGLYNMGLDIRRRATENLALIRRSLDEHTAIVRAIEAADSAAAAAAMAAHLDHIEASTRAVIEEDVAAFSRRSRKSD